LDLLNKILSLSCCVDSRWCAAIHAINYVYRISGASGLNGRRYCDSGLIIGGGRNRAGRRKCVRGSVPRHHLVVLKTHALLLQSKDLLGVSGDSHS
jgi:hypothetical protein